MTRDDVIRMAREAGAFTDVVARGRYDGVLFTPLELELFAALVAAAEREAIAAEFDRRAKSMTGFYEPDEPAEIIRARSKT